jgi:hypothetical protein
VTDRFVVGHSSPDGLGICGPRKKSADQFLSEPTGIVDPGSATPGEKDLSHRS